MSSEQIHDLREHPDCHAPQASIVITTRNRREDAARAVESCLAQDQVDLEVLVYDDASTDGTGEMLRQRFPTVRTITHERQCGYIVHRNAGFRDARGAYIISIDDDAYFTDPTTIARIIALFDKHPDAACIALPYIEARGFPDRQAVTLTPDESQLRSYIGCAHALRRDVVRRLGGYREFFIHQGEERDLSIRLLDAGYTIVYGDAPPIVHLYSPQRSRRRLNYYGFRNTLLMTWLNVPSPYVIPRMLIDTVQLLRHQFELPLLPLRVKAIFAGWGTCLKLWGHRKPVRQATYRNFRSLPRHGPLEMPRSLIPTPVTRQEKAACSTR